MSLLNQSNPNGLHIVEKATALAQKPKATLEFYDYGVILHREGISYPIEPLDVAELLATHMPDKIFDTGYIPRNILCVWEQGKKRVVIAYREAQKTGIWLEGQQDALNVPLPPLAIARITTDNYQAVSYSIIALESNDPDAKTYACPLPNVSSHGTGVCWGTVDKPDVGILRSLNVSEDWANFLGSHFGSHSASGKSKQDQSDIRKVLQKLNDDGAEHYPMDDLISRKQTLSEWIEVLCQ